MITDPYSVIKSHGMVSYSLHCDPAKNVCANVNDAIRHNAAEILI